MPKKIVLICGATGFIGRNIAEQFSKIPAYDVVGVFNKRKPFSCPDIRWIQADLTNPDQVNSVLEGVDILIQAAATTSGIKDIVNVPHIHVTDNVVMNSYLFKAATEKKIEHVVFFSCTIMLQSNVAPQNEHDFNGNVEIYPKYFGAGWTKVYLEKMCQFYADISKTKFTALRHSNIYGPYDKFDYDHSHVFGATITKVLSARDRIIVWGNGKESRDFLFVDDLVNMVFQAINKQTKKFEIFNCGSGIATSVKELVLKVIHLSEKELIIQYDESKPTISTSLCLDCSKAQNLLGWVPKYTLDEGISKTIKWWQENIKL